MANVTLNSKIIIRNDTAARWEEANPILLKGEMGIEIDTGRFKFGDGLTAWSLLGYAADTGTGDMLKSQFASGLKADQGYVDKAELADTAMKLKQARKITLSGDLTGEGSFDGGADMILEASLAELTLTKISDAGSAAAKDAGSAAGNVPVLDADGKLDAGILPAIAMTEVFEAANEAAMLALAAQAGDVAVRSDLSRSFILKQAPASVLSNWVELKTPTDTVLSVNGKTGAVTLTTSDIGEGSRLYYTEARAAASFQSSLAATSVGALSDGANVLLKTDTFILNGGNA